MRLVDVRTSDSTYFGFLLFKRPKLLVMSEIHDFSLRGFRAFVNLKKGTSKRSPSNRVWAMGVKLLGLKPMKLKLGAKEITVDAILKHLKHSKKMALIEFRRAGKDEFFFGQVLDVGQASFAGKFFATNGRFTEEPEMILISSIRQIQWDSAYEKMMARICKKCRRLN